jgi:hypothetical protein
MLLENLNILHPRGYPDPHIQLHLLRIPISFLNMIYVSTIHAVFYKLFYSLSKWFTILSRTTDSKTLQTYDVKLTGL